MEKDLEYFKKELTKILASQYNAETEKENEISKALEESFYSKVMKSLYSTFGIEYVEKGRKYGIGTIREWNGQKFRKIAEGKWRPIYESESRGAKQSIRIIAKKIQNAKSTDEQFEKAQIWTNLKTDVRRFAIDLDGNGNYTQLSKAKNFEEAKKIIKTFYQRRIDRFDDKVYWAKKINELKEQETKSLEFVAVHFANKEDKSFTFETGNKVSRFLEESKKLDEGRSSVYWATPHEMAARAFEAYLCDKLKEKGQKNTYLSGDADNSEYEEYYPYPTEDDRKKINQAFDKLFETITKNGAIRKSLYATIKENLSKAFGGEFWDKD